MSYARVIAWGLVVCCLLPFFFPGLGDVFPAASGLSRLAKDPLTPYFGVLALARAAYLSIPKWHSLERFRILSNAIVLVGIAIAFLTSFFVGFTFVILGLALVRQASSNVLGGGG